MTKCPKTVYVRSRPLLAACRKLSCQHCGTDDGTVVAAHSNWQDLGGKGRSIKADDRYVAALCHDCHAELDRGKEWSGRKRREVWIAAWGKTVLLLVAQGLWPKDVEVPDLERQP